MADDQSYGYLTDSMEEKLKTIDALISLPEVYLKFRELMDNPKATNDNFSDLVSCDPNLAATVLKFVNSPVYALSVEIDSIRRAVYILGINPLHEIVLAIAAMSLDYPNDILPLKVFWRRSLYSGVLARILGQQLRFPDSESLFVIGLLHQIGRLVIYSKYPEQAQRAIAQAADKAQLVASAEQAVLGFHYGHVGAKLMGQWRLPVKFQVITYFQPTPGDAPLYRPETALLHLVQGYAELYGAGQEANLEQFIIPEVWGYLGIVPGQIEATLEQAQQVSAQMEKAIIK